MHALFSFDVVHEPFESQIHLYCPFAFCILDFNGAET